jgi:hypothetical protein
VTSRSSSRRPLNAEAMQETPRVCSRSRGLSPAWPPRGPKSAQLSQSRPKSGVAASSATFADRARRPRSNSEAGRSRVETARAAAPLAPLSEAAMPADRTRPERSSAGPIFTGKLSASLLRRAAMAQGEPKTESFLPQRACRALHRPYDRLYGGFVLGMISELTLVLFGPRTSHCTPLLCLLGHFSLHVRSTRNLADRISTTRNFVCLDALGISRLMDRGRSHHTIAKIWRFIRFFRT